MGAWIPPVFSGRLFSRLYCERQAVYVAPPHADHFPEKLGSQITISPPECKPSPSKTPMFATLQAAQTLV
ncbi:hypothetical protein L6R29_22090 [Myxococcota bacterium]|nr:hypothetical protein [Myxococcota bacterium]